MEQNESHKSKFRAKDHLVSGEYFDITWNESGTIAKTNIENIKDISIYYNSSNYDSFKNTSKGGFRHYLFSYSKDNV